jgi:hypothetical protein
MQLDSKGVQKMTTIWSVQTVVVGPNPPTEAQSQSTSVSQVVETEKEALAEYGKQVKAGLPAGAAFAFIYLWRADPIAKGRSHSIVKHCHIWKDDKGVHSNEFSGAVYV